MTVAHAGGGNPLPERLRATQATVGQGSAGVLQSLLSGIRGVRDRSRSSGAEFVDNGGMNAADGRRESRSTPVGAQGTGVLDAWACGVQQLQELQAQALQKGESSPEAIRQTIPPFPMLKGPSGDQSGLQLQDWLDLVASNAADVSENSSSWWDQVRDFVQGVYATWLRSALLERDQLRLDGGEHLAEGKWGRLMRESAPSCWLHWRSRSSRTSSLARLREVQRPF